jgi:DNA adenine methylase
MKVHRHNSPLRYPGGKAILAGYLKELLEYNNLIGCTYVEPFAGGAGAAIQLLLSGHVKRLILNDADRAIWAFWNAILEYPEELIDRIEGVKVNLSTWKKQRTIYRNPDDHSDLELAFAAFFLNRCNRSGIIGNGSVIGGMDQDGPWKIDARFNKQEQVRRIKAICAVADKISVYNLDAIDFLRSRVFPIRGRGSLFVYLDPPYFVKGSRLYMNHYEEGDHAALARCLKRTRNLRWLVSYDNAPEIRQLYEWADKVGFRLQYSAQEAKLGSEILIFSDSVERPTERIKLRSA